MSDSSREQNRTPSGNAPEQSADGCESWVFWPNGAREEFLVSPSKLEERGLRSASSWLTGLALNGSIVRASIGTGRIQTLTVVVPSSGGPPVAVRIDGGNQRLTLVAVFGARHDVASVQAALALVVEEASIPAADLETLVAQCTTENGVLIANFGPHGDPAVDDAYGMALYLGAAMNGGVPPEPAAPADAPAASTGVIPIGAIALEQLAILNQRSAFILCGFMPGSRQQAQEWDDWLEQYRLPGYGEGVKRLAVAGGEHMVAVNLLTSNAIWAEFRTTPYRFVSVYGTVSAYAIPWNGENVPEITDFQPPDPSQGSGQAAAAALFGKLERFAP